MATISTVVVDRQRLALLYKWTPLTQSGSDVGEAVETPGYGDKAVQLIGTLSVGGQVTIEGSDDGTTWATLTDPLGNTLVMSALGTKQIAELTRYVRPKVTGGDGSTSLTAFLYCRK